MYESFDLFKYTIVLKQEIIKSIKQINKKKT